MRIRAYGRTALLVDLDSLDDVLELLAQVQRNPPCGLLDAVPAARTLLISIDTRQSSLASAAAAVRDVARTQTSQPAGSVPPDEALRLPDTAPDEILVPVTYDGPDLPDVARMLECTPAHVVRRHLAMSYAVAFIGFAPGFYFLAGGDRFLQVPRRPSPRTTVPRGAVALAGEFTGIYPRAGPGGWQVIGSTTAPLWDLDRRPSALLAPKTRVRFVEARP
ncbi:carboxyltransferase domain-containing protein [Actinomycetes bacterium KLBMP 9759]